MASCMLVAAQAPRSAAGECDLRPRTGMTKLQKERARQARQQEKAQRRSERRDAKAQAGEGEVRTGPLQPAFTEDGEPIGFDFHDFEK